MIQTYYQREGEEILYTASVEGGTFAVCTQGGGFIQHYTPENFAKIFKEVKPNLSQRKGIVTADFLRQDIKVPCYSNGLSWNGWGMPNFDRAGVDQVMLAFEPGMELEYHFEGDVLCMQNPEYDANYPENLETCENLKTLKIEPFTAIIDGTPTLLWRVGECWTWNSVKFSDSDEVKTNNLNLTPEFRVASAFVRIIRSWVYPEEFEEIRRRNATYSPGVCATQDFVDANMAMAEAFKEVLGRDPEIYDGYANQQHDIAIWNAAWEIAIETSLKSKSS